ncbi:hypothetical protein Bca52824_012103 [Brassica carinata]|uniref:F-box associated beta-propeller type 3 domain-containing protein n=1 Tax=Brassica carinata TaxID=52824 RepID=A0A8X7VXI6_BRACI|nr:hypothetical protein Bca52824_012103 [Brassica carinata]
MRYRCVSKPWSSITTLPSFINSFTSRSTSRSPTLLVTFASGSEKYAFSFPQHQTPDRSTCSPFYSYQTTNIDLKGSRSESIHGLILSHVFKIWNPTLRANRHEDSHDSIISFDVKSEYFNVINYPEGLSLSWFSSFHMIPYEGRLAFTEGAVYLYILKDAHGRKWTRERYVLHLPYERAYRSIL